MGKTSRKQSRNNFSAPRDEESYEFKHLISFDEIRETLNFLKLNPLIEEVCVKISAQFHTPKSPVLALILWLMKYGCFRIIESGKNQSGKT